MSGTPIGMVDTDVGPLLAPIDPWIWPCLVETGRWEPLVGDLVRSIVRPDDVVVNVGAHVGYFTRLASLADAVVVAYEPVPSNRRLLEINTADLANVTIRPCAASDTPGTGRMHLSGDNPGDHRLDAHPDATGTIPVRIVHLDDELTSCRLILCDAQGADLRVLRGARDLIGRCRPHVLIEFTPHLLDPADFGEVDRLLAVGYSARLIEPDIAVSSAQHAADVLGDGTATMHLVP